MNALKAVGIAAAAVTATLVTVNIIQKRRQKKAFEQFEKAIEGFHAELFGKDFDPSKA